MMQPANDRASPRVRRDGWTQHRRTTFLESLAATASVKLACAAAGLSRQSAYRLQARDAAFAAAWGDALRTARDAATREFLAMLPESLLRAMSESSTPCHLCPPRAGPELAPRTVSH